MIGVTRRILVGASLPVASYAPHLWHLLLQHSSSAAMNKTATVDTAGDGHFRLKDYDTRSTADCLNSITDPSKNSLLLFAALLPSVPTAVIKSVLPRNNTNYKDIKKTVLIHFGYEYVPPHKVFLALKTQSVGAPSADPLNVCDLSILQPILLSHGAVLPIVVPRNQNPRHYHLLNDSIAFLFSCSGLIMKACQRLVQYLTMSNHNPQPIPQLKCCLCWCYAIFFVPNGNLGVFSLPNWPVCFLRTAFLTPPRTSDHQQVNSLALTQSTCWLPNAVILTSDR